jgi:UDP-N-acetylglucosamine--N-acetylmuramyl-(pentapeptide) pyrophosphoryl-undecaprenol N-acetylglucosamine transferase
MNDPNAHIVFAGGGTAGHLIPGLAVAEFLARSAQPPKITFAFSGKPLETRLVTSAGFPHVVVPSKPMPRSAVEALGFLTSSISGYRAASRFLEQNRVSLVVGLGGYASVPMARAALRRGIPLILLEQNAIPGRATRWLASGASAICVAFEDVIGKLPDPSIIRVTGNPIRAPFVAVPKLNAAVRNARSRQLLILGGSNGSRTLNEQVPRAIYKTRSALANWKIVHQTGDRNAGTVRELYRKFGVQATVSTFFDDIPRLLAGTDLVVSRAGGTTLAELAAMSIPAVLVPYEKAAENHQYFNAKVVHDAGAAALIDPSTVGRRLDDQLAETLSHLARHEALRERMAEQARELARPTAARAVVRTIRETLRSRQLAQVA